MATDTKTWPWATTLESWIFTADGGGFWAGTLDAVNGNPVDSLKSRMATKNKKAAAYWSEADTWANLFTNVGAGDTVTQVRIFGLDTRCYVFTDVDEARYSDQAGSNVNALWTDALSAGNELWAGRAVSAVEGSWTSTGAGSNQAVAAGFQPGSSTVEFRLYIYGDTANVGGADLEINHDNLVIEVTYSTGRIPRAASMCPILGG